MPDSVTIPLQTAPAADTAAVDDCWRRIGVSGDGSCAQLAAHIHCRNCPTYSHAAVALLDSIITGNLPDGTALDRAIAPHAGAERDAGRSCLLFRVGDEWLALPTAELGEVTASCPVHSLPHRRHAAMLGVASVRGALLVCISLALLFGARETIQAGAHDGDGGDDIARRGRFLILGQGRSAMALPVAEVAGVRRVGDAELLPLPATLSRASAHYTRALFDHEGRSVGLLDPTLLRQVLTRSLA